MEKTQNLWELLENPPQNVKNIADLYSWSMNYDIETGTPFQKFLDLIGFSDEEFDSHLCPGSFILDYASAETFAAALNEWSVRPHDAFDFIGDLLTREI